MIDPYIGKLVKYIAKKEICTNEYFVVIKKNEEKEGYYRVRWLNKKLNEKLRNCSCELLDKTIFQIID